MRLEKAQSTEEALAFAIHCDHDKDWDCAHPNIAPRSGGSVPAAAVEWVVEFARAYL